MVRQTSLSAALAIMAGAGLMLSVADEAQAAAITQSEGFTTSALNGNVSDPIAFAGFSETLGALTEVDLTLSSPSVSGTEQFSYSGAEGDTGSFSETVAVIEPTSTILTSASGSASAFCRGNGGTCTASGSFVLSSALSTATTRLTDATSLEAFENATASLMAALQNYTPSANPSGSACFFGTCSQTDTVSFAGTLTVAYQYTPATPTAIPEPATLALLGLGAVGVTGTRLRRRSAT